MRLFITRHGQVLPAGQEQTAFDTSKDDPLLTTLGQRQAALMGEELKRCDFNGRIIASPFSRTLMTASLAARACNLSFSVDERFREIVQREEGLQGFQGKTLEEMKALFPEIHQATLPYPWWTVSKNTMEEVIARVRPLVEECIALGADCLLVGHGASVNAAIRILLNGKPAQEMGDIYRGDNMNCSLSEFEIENGIIRPLRLYDTDHLPPDMITSNQRPVEERNGKKCIVM